MARFGGLVMPKTFAITAKNENLKADPKGYAEAVFTVTNTSSRAARGLAKLKALDETKQEWLKIKGEAERDFSPGTPQQIVVAFEGPVLAPKSAGPPKTGALRASGTRTEALAASAPTKYGFRLDVANAALSDEDFTESQIVTVEAAIGQEKKGFPIWIIPVAAVVLIGIGLGLFFLLRPRPVPVPNVIGKTLDDAKATIEQVKLVAVEDQSQVTHTHQ